MAWATAGEDEAGSIVEAGAESGVRVERIGTVSGPRFVISGVIDLSLNELTTAYSGGRE
jgi:hypothetical protein